MKVADLDMNIGAALAGQLDRLLSTAVDVERLALIEAGRLVNVALLVSKGFCWGSQLLSLISA